MNDLKITENANWELCWALQALSKGLTSYNAYELLNELARAQTSISNCIAELSEKVQLTPEEAEFSSNLHTFLRKYCDDDLTSLIYIYVQQSKGQNIWFNFIKILFETKNPNKAKKQLLDFPKNSLDEKTLFYLINNWENESIQEFLNMK